MTTNEGRIALRVKQPRTLEPEGETSAKFKTWRTAVLNFLGQDMDMDQFLPGGRYSTWIAANSSARGDKGRLTSLFEKQAHHGDDYDCDKVTVAQVKAAAVKQGDNYATMDVPAQEELKTKMVRDRLRLRNKQLTRMLSVLSSLVHDSEADQVVDDSTSIDWIWLFLRKRYNIDTRGVNFLRIVKVAYKSGTNHQTYYQELRAAFVDNLRKAGDARSHLKPGDVMPEDEKLSPSFEDAIVLMALEKIDPRLPARVARDYEHRLDRNTHLIDLQSSIFQAVPTMLESLDRDAGLQALATSAAAAISLQPPGVALDAFTPYAGKGRGRGASTGGGKGKQGGGQKSVGKVPPRISPTTGRIWTVKFCRLCEKDRKSPAVVASHDTVECDSVSNAERRSMLAALQAMVLDLNNEDPNGEGADDGAGEGDLYGDAYAQEDFTQGLQNQSS